MRFGCECVVMIKVNVYGIGQVEIVLWLYEVGCWIFFVVVLMEVVFLCCILLNVVIYVFDGLLFGMVGYFVEYDICLVFGFVEELFEWVEFCKLVGCSFYVVVYVDMGIYWFGLFVDEFLLVVLDELFIGLFRFLLIMLYLVCGFDLVYFMNVCQFFLFKDLMGCVLGIFRLLVNFVGVLMGLDFYFDLVWLGILFFGGKVIDIEVNQMRLVVKVEVKIMIVCDVLVGDMIGYGVIQIVKKLLRNVVVVVGYVDGFLCCVGFIDEQFGGFGMICGYRVLVFGWIFMDMIILDVMDVFENLVKCGVYVEMLGFNVVVVDLVVYVQIIDYEYLISLGRCFECVYVLLNKSMF